MVSGVAVCDTVHTVTVGEQCSAGVTWTLMKLRNKPALASPEQVNHGHQIAFIS